MPNDIKIKSDTAKEKLNVQFKAQGKSGTLYTSLNLDEDHLKELQGPEGHEIYSKMLRSDTQVGKVYYAIVNPIKSALWDIEPASDEEQDLKSAALLKHILFNDLPRGWKAKLDEIMTYPFHGHASFEVIFQNREDKINGQYTGLKNLAFRDQRSLVEWRFERESEKLLEVHQRQYGDLDVDTWINGENLLIFYNEKKGSDLGFPILRRLYGPYKRKLLSKQLQIIGVERSAIPVPKLKIPKSVKIGSDEYQAAVDQLESYSNAENAYFLFPDGYELEFEGSNAFDPAKIQTVIKSENEDMMSAILATFLEMGIGGNSGNQAATETLSEFYTNGITYLADGIVETINNILIPRLCELNFGDTLETLPKLVYSGISEEAGKEFMEIVTGYTTAGVIGVDEQLEDFIRKSHNMPAKAQGEQIENKESQNEQANNSNDPSTESNSDRKGNDEDVEFSAKDGRDAKKLINEKAEKLNETIKTSLQFSAAKFINDTIARYKQLPEGKKQRATDKIKMGGTAKFRKAVKADLTSTAFESLAMAKAEVPAGKEVKLSSKPEDILRVNFLCKNNEDLSLNDGETLPAHIRVLIAKQSELIADSSSDELDTLLRFRFSNTELNTNDPEVIRQDMTKAAEDFTESGSKKVKGVNAAALMTNETRSTWFFEVDVIPQIHSFTFFNLSPVSDICKELAGTTFAVTDADSMRFNPPLHHNCKSVLIANLKTNKKNPTITSLSPSAKAKESITL